MKITHDEFNYPFYGQGKVSGITVHFTAPKKGTVVLPGGGSIGDWNAGTYSDAWIMSMFKAVPRPHPRYTVPRYEDKGAI